MKQDSESKRNRSYRKWKKYALMKQDSESVGAEEENDVTGSSDELKVQNAWPSTAVPSCSLLKILIFTCLISIMISLFPAVTLCRKNYFNPNIAGAYS